MASMPIEKVLAAEKAKSRNAHSNSGVECNRNKGSGNSLRLLAMSKAVINPLVKAKAYLALTKPRVIELLLITTVPTMILAQRGMPSLWLVLATLLGGALSAGSANAFSCYLDADIDQ